MPEYIVEDDAGNTLVLEGDSPPTEQELRELFASRSSAPPTHPLVEYMKVPAPTSLEPESQFGFPESFKPPPTEYVQETPKIGAAPPTGVFDDLSRMLGGGMGMTYEEREQARAQGVPVPQTVKSFFTKPPPDIIPKMPTVGEAPPGTVEKIAATAISPLGALAFGPDVPAQVARETYNVAAGLPEFMMSRLGVATALAGAGPRLAVAAIPRAAAPALTSAKWTARGLRNVSPRAVAGGFAADMTKSALEQDEYIQQNWDKMSVPERARALTGLGSTLAMGGALGFHAVGPYTAAMAKAPAPPPRLKTRFFAPEAGPARETSRVFYGQEEGPPVTVMATAQPPEPASRLPLISKPEASVQGRDGVLGIMDRYKVSWDEAVAMQSRARRLYGISKEPAAPAPAPTPTTTPTTAPTPTGEVTEGQRRYMEAAKRRARVMFEDEEVEIPLLTRDEVKGGEQMVMERYGVDEATAKQLIRTSRSVYEVRDLSPEERAHVEAELGTVDVPVRVVEEGEPADPNVPFARRLRRQFMGFNRRTGEIEIYAKEFKEEISRIPESKRAQWVHSRLNEEQWHAWVWRAIGDSGTATYWNSMSWIEQALAHRFYTGRWLVEGTTPEFRGLTASELGHEVIRRRMQRLAGLTPGEILESAFTERWTIRSLEAIENAINAARETFGTRASQEQLRLVDRIHKHVNMVKSALVAKQQVQPDEEQGGPAATGRAVFRVRRLEGTEEDITRRIEALKTMTADEFSADVKAKPGALTGEAYRLGLSVTTREQLDSLKRNQEEAYARGREMANRGDTMGGMQEVMRGQFFREAYEIATGTGSAGYSLRTGSTVAETPIPFQMEEAAEGPGAIGKGIDKIRNLDRDEKLKVMRYFQKATDEVASRTTYGMREEVAGARSYVLIWSNAQNRWLASPHFLKRGETENLDANKILIESPNLTTAQVIAENLPPLGLAAGSFEQGGMLRRMAAELDPNSAEYKDMAAMFGEANIQMPRTETMPYIEQFMDTIGLKGEVSEGPGAVGKPGRPLSYKQWDDKYAELDKEYAALVAANKKFGWLEWPEKASSRRMQIEDELDNLLKNYPDYLSIYEQGIEGGERIGPGLGPGAVGRKDIKIVADEKKKRRALALRLPGDARKVYAERERFLDAGYTWRVANESSGWNKMRELYAKKIFRRYMDEMDRSLTREILAMSRTGRGMGPARDLESQAYKDLRFKMLEDLNRAEGRIGYLLKLGLQETLSKEVSGIEMRSFRELEDWLIVDEINAAKTEKGRQRIADAWIGRLEDLDELIRLGEFAEKRQAQIDAMTVDMPEFGEMGPGLGPAAAGRRREKKVPKEQQELGLGVPVVPPSKGPISKVGEEAMELQKMRIAAAQGEMMPATGAATLRQRTAFVEVTPKALDDFVKDYLNEAVIKTRAKTVPGTKEEGGFRVREKTPFGFKHFANAVRFKFGPVPNEQLREVFADNVGEALMNATGERIVQIVKAMKLVKEVVGGGKPGERRLDRIADAPSALTGKKAVAAAEAAEKLKGMGVEKVTPPRGAAAGQPRQLMMSIAWDKGPVEISKTLERVIGREGPPTSKAQRAGLKLRYRAIAEIMHNLFTEAESLRLPLKREQVFAEELGSPLNAREPVFRSISRRELGDPIRLGEILTSDASVNSYPGFEPGKVPRSITKRLVAFLDKETDEVVLSDIYMDYRKISPVAVKRERVAVVRMGNTHVPLESLLKRYRPIFSILLDDPVHNFSRRYRSISEFHREFGYEAQERMRAMEEPSEGIEPGEEGYDISGTMKRPEFQEGRALIESDVNRPLMDAEVMGAYDWVAEQRNGINSPEDVRVAIESFADIQSNLLPGRPFRAMSAFMKMLRHVMEKNPDMTEGDALYSIARFLYENNKAAGSRQQLIQRTLANYGGEFPRTDVPVDPITEARAGVIRGREAISEQQAVRRAQWLAERGFPPDVEAPKFLFEGAPERPEGISREVVAPERGPIEGVGAGLKGTMARGTEARLSAAEKAAQQGAEAIAEEARKEKVDDSYFDRMLKASSAAEREAIAELEGQIPKREGETTEQWLERVREYAERLEEYKAAQQGAFSEEIGPAAIGRYALPVGKTIADLVGKTVGAGIRIGSEWMVDRLRRVVPPTATITHQHLDKANEIISKSQEYAGDMFYRFGDDVIRESGRTNKATSWMNGFQVIEAGRSAIINSKEAIEGRLQPPAYARDITAKGQEGNYLIGQFIEPVSPGFIANGGMHNNLTAFGYDVIRDGPGTKNWSNIVRGQVIANPGVSARDVTNLLLKYKKVLDDPAADPAALFAINQDFSRALPRTVTHIWTGSKRFGHWEPIIHSDLFNYFNHGIRRTAMIRAFREEYPIRQRGVAQPPSFNLVIDQMRREVAPKYHNLINTLYRTLQGHPSENLVQTGWLSEAALARTPSITQPSGVALRILEPVGDTLRTMLLSQQILLQPGELLSGGSSIFFGFRRSMLATMRHQEMYPILEMEGMVDKILYNNAWQPNAAIRAAFRILNNNARRWTGQNLFNELQEAQAAGAAYITAQRIMMGNMIDIATGKPMVRLTWSERNLMPQTFRVMGFTEAEVKSMMNGDPRLLGQMVRKAASFASGGHMHPSEQSRILANRAVRAFLWFQRYPATRANQFVKLWQVMTEHALAGRKTEARNAGLLLVKFAGVAANQGLLQTALMTAFYGGAFGLVLKLNEMLDSPFAFFFDMWRSAIGGPFQFITRGWEDSGLHGVANNFKRVAVPFNVAGELWEVSAGAGAYKDMELSRRIGKFLQREIPLSKAAKLGVATFGLSLDDPKLDASVAALGKWKRKKFGFEDTESFWKEDEGKTLRIEMKKAVEALKDGDTEAYLTARREAVRLKLEQGKLESEAVQDVNQSFLARRLLYNPQTRAALTPEELDELESRIGGDAFQRLQDFDKMLEEVAGKKSEP